MINDKGKSIKRKLQFINVIAVIVIVLLSMISLFLPKGLPIQDTRSQGVMDIMPSLMGITFGIVLILTGVLFPDKEYELSQGDRTKVRAIKWLAFILDKDKLSGITPLVSKTPQTIYRSWNPAIIIMFFLIMIVFTLINAFMKFSQQPFVLQGTVEEFMSFPYGLCMVILLGFWLVLCVTSIIWTIYDKRERQVLELEKQEKKAVAQGKEDISIICHKCSRVFKYRINEGYCPSCKTFHEHSEYTGEDLPTKRKQKQSRKGSILALIMILLIIIYSYLDTMYFSEGVVKGVLQLIKKGK